MHHFLEIFVRGANDSNVHFDVFRSPNRAEALLLYGAKQLYLDGGRNFAHFVKKKGAGIGHFELAGAPCGGIGKRPFFMAEQLAFNQGIRDCPAVNDDERTRGAGTVVVNGPRHQFFASPTLALNEHGEIGGRDSFDTGAEGLHLVTGPNQRRTRLGRLTLRRLLAVPCGFDDNSPHGCKKSELARDARMERLTIERRHLEHGAPVDADAAVVDTNIARVLARLAGERLTARRAQVLADELCPTTESWMWNQAIMDLGATVCTPRSPDCTACPLAKGCAARIAAM